MSFEQHAELSEQLHAMREQAMATIKLLEAHRPFASADYRNAFKVLGAIDKLRCSLDDSSCAELPRDEWAPDLYYGPLDAPHRVELIAHVRGKREATR